LGRHFIFFSFGRLNQFMNDWVPATYNDRILDALDFSRVVAVGLAGEQDGLRAAGGDDAARLGPAVEEVAAGVDLMKPFRPKFTDKT
jgi:hypothetical protein